MTHRPRSEPVGDLGERCLPALHDPDASLPVPGFYSRPQQTPIVEEANRPGRSTPIGIETTSDVDWMSNVW